MKQSGILFLIILFNYCFSQEKHETISIKEEYTPLKTYDKANYIFWYCMDFYESKELDAYIKKLTGMKNSKK